MSSVIFTAGSICSIAPWPRSGAMSKSTVPPRSRLRSATISIGAPTLRGVIDRLAANPFPTPYVALKGNHETFLEAFLADPATGLHWRLQGGDETLFSYGVAVQLSDEEAAERLRAALPATHVRFLQSLKMSHVHGKYFLCHAGVRPGVPLERQDDQDLLWIRGAFLNSAMDFGKIVVHGHTPVPEPEVLPNRINVDTGAFASGRLTCVALDEGGHRFLAV